MVGRITKAVGGIVAASAVIFGGTSYLKTQQSAAKEHVDIVQPSGAKWHDNWDRRAIESYVQPPRKASEFETYEQRLLAAQPKTERHIILIRHGQYEEREGDLPLSALGRQQAEYCAKRLKELDLPISKIYYSTMTRATETGHIICKHFPDIPSEGDSILEEGVPPAVPSPEHAIYKPEPWEHFSDGQRMEAAFRKYFHRASPQQEKNSYEILACHGNVIRYFTLRALQLPPEAWLRLQAYNASMTWLVCYPDGNVVLRGFGNVGHLPPDKITDGFWTIVE